MTTKAIVHKKIQEITGEVSLGGYFVADVATAKVAWEEGKANEAFNLILQCLLRLEDTVVRDTDDLTKLLNTVVDVRIDTGQFTLRDLIKEGWTN